MTINNAQTAIWAQWNWGMHPILYHADFRAHVEQAGHFNQSSLMTVKHVDPIQHFTIAKEASRLASIYSPGVKQKRSR